MKRVSVFVLITLLALTACQELDPLTGAATQQEPITIGVIAPLTGSAAQFGQSVVNGIRLAANNTNTRLIVEDGKCDAKTANDAAIKLIQVDDVDYIIGGVCSPETLAIEPHASKNKVVQISPVSSAPQITQTPVIRLYPSDVYQAQEGVRILQEINATSVGVLYMNNDYGAAMLEEFTSLWDKRVYAQAIEVGGTDYRTQILKLQEQEPDAVYVIGLYHEAGVAAKQIHELGIDVPLVSTESVKDEQLFEIAGIKPLQGLRFPVAVPANTSAAQEFEVKYYERFGEEPGVYAPYGYDSFNVLYQAIQDTDGSYREVHAYLRSNEFLLATGSVDFDENGDVRKPQQVMVVSGTSFVEV